MLCYWVFAALYASGIVKVPPEYMYSDPSNPLVIAWNWSFFPIDVMFAGLGLGARFGNLSKARREIVATASLVLMFCAGLMAIAFWAIQLDFDFFWWGVNCWLIVLSLWALSTNFHAA